MNNMVATSHTIQLEMITDTAAFNRLRPLWNDTLRKSGIDNPFLRHEWLSAWWAGYGEKNQLRVLHLTNDGKTLGLIPLMISKTSLSGIPLDATGFLGNHWTRMDILLADDHEACLEALITAADRSSKVWILAQMDQSTATFAMLIEALRKHRMRYSVVAKPHTYIPLQGSWTEYFNSQSYNFRMDSRRKLKRLEKEGALHLKSLSPEDKALEKIAAIAANSWQSKDAVNIVTSPEGRRFYETLADDAGGMGLDFSVLELNDRPVAYMVGIVSNGCYFAFDTAYDKDVHQHSPGLILHNLLLQRLFDQRITRLDLGYMAHYKNRWTEERQEMSDIIIYPRNLMGKVVELANQVKDYRNRKKLETEKKDA